MKQESIATIQSFIAARYADSLRPGEPDDMALLLKNVAEAIDLCLPPAPPSLEELMRRVAKLEQGDRGEYEEDEEGEDDPDEELESRFCEIETKLKALAEEHAEFVRGHKATEANRWSQVGELRSLINKVEEHGKIQGPSAWDTIRGINSRIDSLERKFYERINSPKAST